MAASLWSSSDYAPTAFSPTPETVKIAVAMLAVAGLAGLWRGAAETMDRGNAEPPAVDESRAVRAQALPMVAATADTMIPAQAAETLAPAPVAAKPARAPSAPAAEPEAEAAPASEAAPAPVVEAAPAATAPTDRDLAEPVVVPDEEFAPPPPEDAPPAD